MSNIYIQEPLTSGKVVLKTSVGDIDVELWAKECPKACRNFIQLCMEGYYDGTIFHRVVKGFIVQGGDPNGDGTGGESIWGDPFKDEFHSRLRYIRRGLVGMANSGKDDNASQFFFTMAPTPELQNKNTLFGKVTGDTLYNMLKLQDGLVDHNERPMYPPKIIKTEILNNPFDDIQPRSLKKKSDKKDKRKKVEKGVKNFGLLSFGEEAEEDEEETNVYVQQHAGKAKSLHDVVDDPKLSKSAVKLEPSDMEQENRLSGDDAPKVKEESDPEEEENRLKRIQSKLKSKLKSSSTKKDVKVEIKEEPIDVGDSDEDVLITREQEVKMKIEKKKEELRQEMLAIKKDYQTQKKIKNELLEKKTEEKKEIDKDDIETNDIKKSYLEERQKYKEMCSKIPKKGASREQMTLSLLAKFRSKLNSIKQCDDEENESEKVKAADEEAVEEDIKSDNWMKRQLNFQANLPILAKDASTKDDDWYDVYDPRNPLNKRKRGEGSGKSHKDIKKLK